MPACEPHDQFWRVPLPVFNIRDLPKFDLFVADRDNLVDVHNSFLF